MKATTDIMKVIIQIIHKYGIKKFALYSILEIQNNISNFVRGSFSQKGEDLVIARILKNKKKGFYVDIGAQNPDKLNNSKWFYIKGWNGINIEPNPRMYHLLKLKRDRDINLNVGISYKPSPLLFYEFSPDAFSTFSKVEANRYKRMGYKLVNKYIVQTDTLSNVFKKYVKKQIDFISIDTEGNELEVLKSNNWQKYKPRVICVETSRHSLLPDSSDKKKKEIMKYLATFNYGEYYSNNLNTIFTCVNC